MRRHIVPLFASNLVAFGSVGASYLLYSRLLTAEQFGAYAAALAVGNLAVLVLDGGIRTSIIKHDRDLTDRDESSLLGLMFTFSLVLLLALYGGQSLLVHFFPAVNNQTAFVSAFAAVYLLTYPWIGLSTASLERQLLYSKLAWIESSATVIERAAPALLLAATKLGLGSFVVALLIGRLARIVLVGRLHPINWKWRWTGDMKVMGWLLKEGLAFQLGGSASLIRDNAHVIIVGPLFGAAWVGYYAWGLQLCTIASQAFVQISARVSLPVTAKASGFVERWPTITLQVALLTAATAPILALVLLISPAMNQFIFKEKWSLALTLLPLLCARMIPGIACTPVGTMLLVEKGAARYAGALWAWTAIEISCAYLCTEYLGPKGLAVSYAVTAWTGLFVFIRSFDRSSVLLFKEICLMIVARPAFWGFVFIASLYLWYQVVADRGLPLALIACGILLSLATYFVDPIVRSSLRRT